MKTIKITLTIPVDYEAQFLRVEAEPRYWEDAEINGQPDEHGTTTPLRIGECWAPTIDLVAGSILNWPIGITADIHFKVCDQGEYWLQDANGKDFAKYASSYVPGLLSVGESGYGDYIIMKVGPDGKIKNWVTPQFDEDNFLSWLAIGDAS